MLTLASPVTTGRLLRHAAFYDLLVWGFTHGRARAFRERLIRPAHLAAGESVLDVGCGTGSLALVAKRQVGPAGHVTGIDPSPEMVARAGAKASRAGLDVRFSTGVIEALPVPDQSVDVVLSTLMLHHLPRPVRRSGLAEIRRALKPAGRVLLVDFIGRRDRGSFIERFHRHGVVERDEILGLIDGVGWVVQDEGPVGVGGLQYFVAAAEGGA